MADILAFDERSVVAIAEAVRKSQRDIRELQGILTTRVGQPVGRTHVCKTGASSIPAMSGTTPGTGTVTLTRFNEDNDLVQSEFRRTVFNFGNQTIGPYAYGLIWQEQLTGRFVTTAFPGIVRFQLTEALQLGSEAAAVIVGWNGATYGATTTEITVKDFTATPGSWSGPSGRNGWAWLPPDADNGKYEIVWMENTARFVEFLANEDMGYTTSGEMAATLLDWYDIKQPGDPIIVTDPRGLFKRALAGGKGKAWYNPKTDKYVIVQCETKAGWIEFEIRAGSDLADGDALVDVLDWGGSQQDILHPDVNGAGITVYDTRGLFKRAIAGARGFAKYDVGLDRYDVWQCETKAGWIRFVLTDDLASGSATSTTTDFGGVCGRDIQNPGNVTVYDDAGNFPRAVTGAIGLAIYDAIDDKYRVISCNQLCITAKATLAADLCGGSTATITGFTATSPAPFSLVPATLPTSATNPDGHRGLSGAAVWLQWDDVLADWVIIDIARVAMKVPVVLGGTGAFRIDGGNLQGYMVTIAGEYCTAPEWENLLPVADCDS